MIFYFLSLCLESFYWCLMSFHFKSNLLNNLLNSLALSLPLLSLPLGLSIYLSVAAYKQGILKLLSKMANVIGLTMVAVGLLITPSSGGWGGLIMVYFFLLVGGPLLLLFFLQGGLIALQKVLKKYNLNGLQAFLQVCTIGIATIALQYVFSILGNSLWVYCFRRS